MLSAIHLRRVCLAIWSSCSIIGLVRLIETLGRRETSCSVPDFGRTLTVHTRDTRHCLTVGTEPALASFWMYAYLGIPTF
ncbi:hypothetical protein BJY52DRAFT_136421 [Lactarius psammicola]|nr:hypothetical protein BJY52DRAFT_136421 [Lactarius psammicola]